MIGLNINSEYLKNLPIEQKAEIGEKFLLYISAENREQQNGIRVIDAAELANGIGLSYEQAVLLGIVEPQRIVYQLLGQDEQTGQPTRKWALSIDKIQDFWPWMNADEKTPRAIVAEYYPVREEIYNKKEFPLIRNKGYEASGLPYPTTDSSQVIPDQLDSDFAQIESYLQGFTPFCPSGIETKYIVADMPGNGSQPKEFRSLQSALACLTSSDAANTSLQFQMREKDKPTSECIFTVAAKTSNGMEFYPEIGYAAEKYGVNRVLGLLAGKYADGREINIAKWHVEFIPGPPEYKKDALLSGVGPSLIFYDRRTPSQNPKGKYVKVMSVNEFLSKDLVNGISLDRSLPNRTILKSQASILFSWVKAKVHEYDRPKKPSLSAVLSAAQDRKSSPEPSGPAQQKEPMDRS